ncbi:MAG TPA: PQQ-dependent sugar dehydrogenase [Pirellulaceae bacterium]|jgi:glucose/arabinose dehydrogenase
MGDLDILGQKCTILETAPMFRTRLFGWFRNKKTTRNRARKPAARKLRVESLETRELLSTLPDGFVETQLVNGVNPTGFAFAPDGRMFVANKNGTVTVVHKDGTKASQPFVTVAVDQFRDRGLTSVLVDPNYAQNHFVYIYYTAAVSTNQNMANNGALTRLVRLTASSSNPDVADPSSAVTIIDGVPSPDGIHVGGFMQFGADGMLYLGVGEGDVRQNAQDLSNIYGKVLRLNVHNYPNIIPSDNPFVGIAGDRPEIWAYGFRNPFSGNVNPGTNDVLVNDVGNAAWEEVDRLVKGGNYGWPNAEGTSTNSAYINPLFTYPHNGAGACVVGGVFYTGTAFPASYAGQYFIADLVQGNIQTVNPTTGQGTVFGTNVSSPTDVDMGPDGNLYWSQISPFGAIFKISFTGSTDRAPTAVASADVTSGPSPLTVHFDASRSTDPDNDALTYSWNFGDGTTGSGVSATHTYSSNGQFNAVLTVRDRPTGGLSNTAAAIVINVGNNAPVPTITLPLTTDKYAAGQTITFAGTGTDVEDGTLPASAFHWSFLFGHNTHFHDFIGPIDGVKTASFVIPKTGETDPDQYYRIFLTVTDSKGLSSQTFRDIRPVTSTFTVSSNITGTNLLLDGSPIASGTATLGVVGMTRTIEAPLTQVVGGITYNFVGWSDGGAAKHSFDTAATNTTYTAQYQAQTSTAALAAAYSSNAPTHVIAGQTVTYQVTVTNTGTQTWTATGTNKVRLGVYFAGVSDAVGAWSKEPARFALTSNVAPGKSVTFNVKVTAPSTPGTYVLRDRMVKEYVAWFNTMEKINVTVDSLTASYSGTIPTTWSTGQAQRYSITVTNRGTTTWHAAGADQVRLGVYFGKTSDTPPTTAGAIKYFNLPNDLAPGQSATLTVDIVAPTSTGTYTLRNRMFSVQDGWFNDMLRTSAAVQKLSAQYTSSPPTTWKPGETKTYSITLVNTGSTTWNATGTNKVQLGVYFNGSSDNIGAWATEPKRFALPHDVAPGASVTIKVTITAPTAPGTYVLRQRMVKEFVNWFVPLQKTTVTVK